MAFYSQFKFISADIGFFQPIRRIKILQNFRG
jgi:hypothetical protein